MSEVFISGSPVVVATLALLMALSVTTWSVALLKLWRQIKARKTDRQFQRELAAAQDVHARRQVIVAGKGDMAQLGQAVLNEIQQLRSGASQLLHAGQMQEALERALGRELQNIQRLYERGQAELATIGSTAPFVGLFGTVWGIMHALQDIGKSGSASLDMVAGPIGEALIATAIGIATALPAVLAYNYFVRRLRVRMTELENFAYEQVRILSLVHMQKQG